MLLDTSDKNIELSMEMKKQDLIKQKLERGFYTASDIVLVRATDHVPKNGVIKALSNVPFVCKLNDAFHEVAYRYILKTPDKIKDLDYNKSMQIITEDTQKAREFSPWSTQYRSSVHFCLNGIVSSHMQGNFDNNYIVIMEPFAGNESTANILAVRGEDTYFKDEVQLSDKAIILIEASHLDELLDQNINPNIKIIPYRGDRDVSVEWVLLAMFDVVPELIGKDYIIESETSKMITDFISVNNYPSDKHWYSKSYKEDDEKNLKLWEIYAKDFLTYLFSKMGDVSQYESIIDKLSKNTSSFSEETITVLEKIIQQIGVESYINIIKEYNHSIDEQIELGAYPTNNEILNGKSFRYSASKTK